MITSDYELQLTMMERSVVERTLTVEEIRGDLSLHIERLNSKSMNNGQGEILEAQALSVGSLKESVIITHESGTSHFTVRIVQLTMVEMALIFSHVAGLEVLNEKWTPFFSGWITSK
jgi:hypothetical protein